MISDNFSFFPDFSLNLFLKMTPMNLEVNNHFNFVSISMNSTPIRFEWRLFDDGFMSSFNLILFFYVSFAFVEDDSDEGSSHNSYKPIPPPNSGEMNTNSPYFFRLILGL